MQTVLLIDGENIKGKIKEVFKILNKPKTDWPNYNFKGLFDKILQDAQIDRRIFYFGKIKEHPQTKEKSKKLIEEQRLLKTYLENQGFEVVLSGRVRGQIENNNHTKDILVFKEKGVDVKIAVDMVAQTCDKKLKEIFLCSSDSDLQPAIKEVFDRGVKLVYIGFENNPNKGLSYTTHRTILIRNSEVVEFGENKTLF